MSALAAQINHFLVDGVALLFSLKRIKTTERCHICLPLELHSRDVSEQAVLVALVAMEVGSAIKAV